jgi:hypothetical protein
MGDHLTAGKRLKKWLDDNGHSKAWLAEQLVGQDRHGNPQIGIGRSVVWRWLEGERMPRVDFAAQIERITSGKIPASLWIAPRRHGKAA